MLSNHILRSGIPAFQCEADGASDLTTVMPVLHLTAPVLPFKSKTHSVKSSVVGMKRRRLVDMVIAMHFPLARIERRWMQKQRETPF